MPGIGKAYKELTDIQPSNPQREDHFEHEQQYYDFPCSVCTLSNCGNHPLCKACCWSAR